MRYKLIIFDIDGTITTHISSWRYIHEKLGLWQDRAFKYQEDFLAGRIDYKKFCELYMPDRIRKEMDFDYTVSNRLISRDGKLTGGVSIKLAHGAKHEVLAAIFRKFGVRPREVISVGDSEGDIPLARETGYSIAFNSTSRALSKMADYNCRTKDFTEVYRKIISVI